MMYLPAQYKKGFTVFFAMLVASLALALGIAIYDLTVRELDISETVTDSQFSIYAADTGIECALYWDRWYSDEDFSAFGTTSAAAWPDSGVECAGQDIAEAWTHDDATEDSATTLFRIEISAPTETDPEQKYCADVEVNKHTENLGDPESETLYTTIISRGYNTCDEESALRTERALQVSY